MKAIVGEYGKIIILSIVLCSMLLFLFGGTGGGFMGLLSKAKPEKTVGSADSFELAEAIFSRKPPVLSVTVQKLDKGREYNLLDAKEFQVKAHSEEGDALPISVERIIDPGQQDITGKTAPEKFVPESMGTYLVLYKAVENYEGSMKITEKEYRFLVD